MLTHKNQSAIRVVLMLRAALCLGLGLALLAVANVEGKGPGAFLFSYFIDNGQDGLHLAYSRDGLTWTALGDGKSYLAPTVGGKLMRDPCIMLGPDKMFHMVWTTGWWDQGIGLAHSRDLITWSEPEFLPVMAHEPTAANAWAPEILYDDEAQQYVISWSTAIPWRFPESEQAGDVRTKDGISLNHRVFRTTTRDFTTYTQAELLYNPGFPVIDASILHDGLRFVMFLKDETKRPEPHKTIHVAFADHALGPYGPPSAPISVENWVEGPTAFRVGKDVFVLFDAYTRKRFEGLRTSDFKTWEPITDKLVMPDGVRHGTVFAVPDKVLKNLLEQK
jgi:hypothetical protein